MGQIKQEDMGQMKQEHMGQTQQEHMGQKHILSIVLLETSIVNVLTTIFTVYDRMYHRTLLDDMLPDMLNGFLWNEQMKISGVQIVLTVIVFLIARLRLRKLRKASALAINSAQSETIEGKRQSLSLTSISQLVQIWAAILIGMQVIYDITVICYKEFITDLSSMLTGSATDAQNALISLYNSTHGFKYIGMFTAIVLGFVITGIFLKDRKLLLVSLLIAVLFIAAFLVLRMSTIRVFGYTFGVVWTSVIFHLMETAGLFFLSIYLYCFYHKV